MTRRSFGQRVFAMGAGALLRSGTNSLFGSAPLHWQPKLSVMLWTLPQQLTFAQKLHIVANAGYSSVELLNEYENWTAQEWSANLNFLRSLHLSVDSAVPGRVALADPSERKALQAGLLKAVPGAGRLGCRQFIYTAWNRVPGQIPAQQRSAIVDSLRYAADVLEKYGFEIVLEPIDLLEHAEEAVTSVTEALEIIDRVNSPRVKVLFDIYHEQRQAGNLIEKLQNNINRIGLVHVADVPGRHRPGTGEIHYANIYRKLAELNYQRFLCMEFLPQGDPVTELRTARLDLLQAVNASDAAS